MIRVLFLNWGTVNILFKFWQMFQTKEMLKYTNFQKLFTKRYNSQHLLFSVNKSVLHVFNTGSYSLYWVTFNKVSHSLIRCSLYNRVYAIYLQFLTSVFTIYFIFIFRPLFINQDWVLYNIYGTIAYGLVIAFSILFWILCIIFPCRVQDKILSLVAINMFVRHFEIQIIGMAYEII